MEEDRMMQEAMAESLLMAESMAAARGYNEPQASVRPCA